MAILKPSELVRKDILIRMIIAGHPGIGKTTLALSAPAPLLIDSDMGVTRVRAEHRKDCIRPSSYEELKNDLNGDLSEYKSIVIDTGGELLNLMKAYVIKENPKNGKTDGNLSLQGYGAVGAEFARFVSDCYYRLKKHLIVVFHAKEEKDGDDTVLRILVEGSTKNNIWQPMDLGGFIEIKGDRRTLSFDNCERHYGKATHGVAGVYDIPRLGYYDDANKWVSQYPNDFLTKLFDQVNKNVSDEISLYEDDLKQYEAVMYEVSSKIACMTFDTIPVAEDAIKEATHVLTSEKELKDLFKKRLKDLGIRWDKKVGAYVSDNSNVA